MGREIQAVHDSSDSPRPRVFLAGSIEIGSAEDLQRKAAETLLKNGITVLNPRRDDFDLSAEQNIEDDYFREQVEWELRALEAADAILMYFAPETKSPISLLELGLFARSGKLVVCCPEGFWRKGNVDVVCAEYGIKQVSSIYEALGRIAEVREG